MNERILVNSNMPHLESHENRKVGNICARDIIEERIVDWDSDSTHSVGEYDDTSVHVRKILITAMMKSVLDLHLYAKWSAPRLTISPIFVCGVPV